MRAVILAGGKGTRLKPYTATLPKPLVPIGDRSILDIVLTQLQSVGVTEVTMAVNHLAHLIMAYFGDGQRWNLKIDYSLEDKPLSTIAPLKLINDLPENFFVMNGDILTDLNYQKLYAYHIDNDSDVTVATYNRNSKVDYGVLKANKSNQVIGFEEKPVYNFNVSMGVYVFNRRLLDIVPTNKPYGFDNLMLDCIKKKRKALIFEHKGFWLDLGRPDDYEQATNQAQELIERLLEGCE